MMWVVIKSKFQVFLVPNYRLYNQLVRDVSKSSHHSSVVHRVGCVPCLSAWRPVGCAGGIVGAVH